MQRVPCSDRRTDAAATTDSTTLPALRHKTEQMTATRMTLAAAVAAADITRLCSRRCDLAVQ